MKSKKISLAAELAFDYMQTPVSMRRGKFSEHSAVKYVLCHLLEGEPENAPCIRGDLFSTEIRLMMHTIGDVKDRTSIYEIIRTRIRAASTSLERNK